MVSQEKIAVSIVIPVHNEEMILASALARLAAEFSAFGVGFEIIPVENGSRDRTWELCVGAAAADPRVRPLRSEKPDYGYALKQGLLSARGELIISDEIDVLDHVFHRDAMKALESCDLVIASKRHRLAHDERGFTRRLGTDVITWMLKLACGLKSSDTHGPKAWRAATAQRLVKESSLDGDLFASEAVLRAERAGLRIVELPLSIAEKRPTPISLFKRIPKVLRDIRILRKALKA